MSHVIGNPGFTCKEVGLSPYRPIQSYFNLILSGELKFPELVSHVHMNLPRSAPSGHMRLYCTSKAVVRQENIHHHSNESYVV